MSLDAMKQALEALESNPDAMVDCGDGHWDFKRDLAITALRAAIEQAQDSETEETELETYKRLYALRGKALERPCSNCGHQPAKIKAMAQPEYKPRRWQRLTEEEIARRESVNPIRVRIMQEAYDLADRDDSEGYNSVKAMCSDVLVMINKLLDERKWQGLTADEIWQCNAAPPESAVEYHVCMAHQNVLDFAEAIEAKLKEKNNAR